MSAVKTSGSAQTSSKQQQQATSDPLEEPNESEWTSSTSSSLSSSCSSINITNSDSDSSCSPASSRRASLAPPFKYQQNFEASPIEEVRSRLRQHCAQQVHSDPEAAHFYAADLERMLADDWLVSRFLFRGRKEARQSGKPLVDCTLALIERCSKLRRQFNVSSASNLAPDSHLFARFPAHWLAVGGLLVQGHDRAGNAVLYMRVKLHRKQLLHTPQLRHLFKELLLCTLEQADRKLRDRPGRGICCVFDMSQASLDNFDLELMSWMVGSFKSCSPKLLASVIVYNLPWFLSAAFKLIRAHLSAGAGKSVRFVYGAELLSYVEAGQLPDYLAACSS